jgi:predicted RNA-binding protein YlqC (UPF0109 family)
MAEHADTDQLVKFIVASLVDNPDDVQIERSQEGEDVTFEITVNPDDTGKVIGRQGRIIKAIRTIARAAGMLDGTQVYVEVLG